MEVLKNLFLLWAREFPHEFKQWARQVRPYGSFQAWGQANAEVAEQMLRGLFQRYGQEAQDMVAGEPEPEPEPSGRLNFDPNKVDLSGFQPPANPTANLQGLDLSGASSASSAPKDDQLADLLAELRAETIAYGRDLSRGPFVSPTAAAQMSEDKRRQRIDEYADALASWAYDAGEAGHGPADYIRALYRLVNFLAYETSSPKADAVAKVLNL